MRVDLRDGQWAELRDRINHGDDKEIQKVYVEGRADPVRVIDAQTVMVRKFLRAWSVRDVDGVDIPLDQPDAIDRAPEDVVDALFKASLELYRGATVPNPPTPPSLPGSPSAGQ